MFKKHGFPETEFCMWLCFVFCRFGWNVLVNYTEEEEW